ncbi:MAG: hypothetical protein ACRDZ8_14440 [Acidimicrobiales bacterium]
MIKIVDPSGHEVVTIGVADRCDFGLNQPVYCPWVFSSPPLRRHLDGRRRLRAERRLPAGRLHRRRDLGCHGVRVLQAHVTEGVAS